jgi:hypothetical protein
LLSERPEYNQKIVQAHLLAAVAFLTHLPNRLLRSVVHPLMDFFMEYDVKLVDLSDIFQLISPFAKVLCNDMTHYKTTQLCKEVIFAIVGKNDYQEEIDPVRIFFLIFTKNSLFYLNFFF